MKKLVTAITTTTIAFSGASALTVSADAHEVVKRDTLWGISQKNDASVEDLMEWNKLSSTLIYPGQRLSTTKDKVDKPKATVKAKDKQVKDKSNSATHTVVAGDTLSEIAFEYGVKYEDIMEWNDLSTTLIFPDQELKVKQDDKNNEKSSSENKVEVEESEEKVESKEKTTEDKEENSEKKVEQENEEEDKAVKSESESKSKLDAKTDTEKETKSNQEKTDEKITASSGDTYTVNAGDTLSEIAFAHNVSFDKLMEWNNLSDTLIVPGNTLAVNESGKQISDDSSDEQKDNEVNEEPKQEEVKEEPTQEEKSESTSEQVEQEESKQDETPDSNKKETSKKEEPKQEEEVTVEVEKQEEPTESESSSETSGETMTVEATAYTAECEGCTGITATGIDLNNDRNKKVIAVDPSVIPLGSTVKVDGYGTAIAGDTGGAIKGNIIDLHMPTTEDALQWGRQEVNIEILD